MKDLVEALAPWPVVQGIVIGLLVAGAAFWAMRRGLQDRNRHEAGADEPQPVRLVFTDEEKRLEWGAYQQLENIEQNTFKMALTLEQLLEATRRQTEAMNRHNDIMWNAQQK
ncbi:hypothetical protein [Bradyrhizobium sp. ORS 86]|uniref:hypothetical protein n=1 Tax=Bradyrhizobium sp. ORS 86 TaxID=1685970 RepID=UPI00389049DB